MMHFLHPLEPPGGFTVCGLETCRFGAGPDDAQRECLLMEIDCLDCRQWLIAMMSDIGAKDLLR